MQGTATKAQRSAQRMGRRVEQGAGRSKHSPWVERLGRAGYVAMGISYGIVAYLALRLAFGEGGETTDRQGALKGLADERGGSLLLGLLAVGFAGYAIWRFVQAFLDRDDEGTDAKGLAKRASYVGRGVVYAMLCFVAVSALTGSSGGGGGSREEKQQTSTVFDWPAGRWIVGLAGVAIAGFAVYQIVRAFKQDWEEDLRPGTSPTARHWMTRLGVIGHVARGVVFGLIGAFLVKAAVEYDANEAIGLDEALRKVANQAYGQWLLAIVAAGLLAYGVFCVAQARYREI